MQPGKGEELAHAIGRRYFEQATQLADHAMLLDAVEQIGLDRAAAAAYLDSDGGFDAVEFHVSSAHGAGINSIPVFIFSSGGDNPYQETVHGSADVERFSEVFRAIKRHWGEQQSPALGAETCS